MALKIIIDGYNVIKNPRAFFTTKQETLEKSRDNFISKLHQYKHLKKHKVVVVFDGWQNGWPTESSEIQKGIVVIYSKRGEKADDVIKRLVSKKDNSYMVITSDRELAHSVEKQGAIVISSDEFEAKLVSSFTYSQKEDEEVYDESLDRPITTKKKGPSQRLSKSERKKRRLLKKL